VLINFSKTICGIIIDFSQLIMNAFISVFNVGGQAMTNMMGLNDLMTFVKNNPDTKVADHARIFGAYIFALIYMLIAVIVVFVLLAVLVVRIVMLWIYIVLSPLAYFLATFPQGGKYVSQWWDDFTKNVIVGPVLAFFLWLSFVSLGNGNVGTEVLQQSGAQSIFSDAAPTGGLTAAMTTDNLLKFVISIGMLIGGLIITQQMGGYMGKIAGAGMAKIQGGAALVRRGAKAAVALPVANRVDRIHEATGIDLNLGRAWQTLQTRRKATKQVQYQRGIEKAGERISAGGPGAIMALTGSPGDAWNQITKRGGIRELLAPRREKNRATASMELERLQRDLTTVKNINEIDERAKSRPARIDEADYANDWAQRKHGDRTTEIASLEKDILSDRVKLRTGAYSGKPLADLQKSISDNEKKLALVKAVDKDIGDEGTGNVLDIQKKKAGYMDKRQSLLDEGRKDSADRSTLVASLIPADRQLLSQGVKPFEDRVAAQQRDVARFAPIYTTEARKAGQIAEAAEGDPFKHITDSGEKSRILMDAIRNGNQALTRAMMKQMAANGDDNEFLQALAGRTDATGIQMLMRALSGTSTQEDLNFNPDLDGLNRLFSEQQASALGSEISMLAKGTNHWAATAAYKMEGGTWQATNEQEQADYRRGEISKLHPQNIVRSLNRLAYGWEDSGRDFHLDAGGVMTLKLLDNNAGIDQIKGNLLESAAAKLTSDKAAESLRNLVASGDLSQELVDAIFTRAKSKATKPASDINQLNSVLLS